MSFIIKCLDCGHTAPYFPTSTNCPRCNSQWREAEYDYDTLARTLPLQLPGRSFDMWRYRELLPVRNPNAKSIARRRRLAAHPGHQSRPDARNAKAFHKG